MFADNQYKLCPKCDVIKTVSEFGIRGGDRAGLGQLKSWCRRCEADRQNECRASKEQRDLWPSRQPSVLAANMKKWRQNNPEKARLAAKKHHPAARKRWREKNGPAVQRERRSAALRKLKKGCLGIEYAEILAGDPCSYCGVLVEHIDHIDPVACGGTSHWWNLTGACAFCNGSKKDKPLLIFLATRETIGVHDG